MAKKTGHKIMRKKVCKGHAGSPIIYSENGIALVLVLVISVIALAIMAALIYMITSGTQISGMQKRYRTAQEAGLGGADIAYLMIAARGNPNIPNINFLFSTAFTTPCMTAKMNTSTSAANWAACADYNQAISISIDPNDPDTYDTTFQLGTTPLQYTVYTKIVNTVAGNSGGDEGLLKGGVVSSTGEITVVSVPYLYTLEVDTENTTNRAERSKYSILYEY